MHVVKEKNCLCAVYVYACAFACTPIDMQPSMTAALFSPVPPVQFEC